MSNFSFSRSTFPSSWKHSIVLPLSKTNNSSSPLSFRPISLPPFFSKLLECICFSQLAHSLMSFISNFNILSSCQSDFRRSHSMATEMLYISDVVLRNFDKSPYFHRCAGLHKSFRYRQSWPTILLVKLKLCGLSHLAFSLICSFLTNHTQQILIYNPFSLFSSTCAFSLVYPRVPFLEAYSLIFLFI